jgi:hypothetical protein
VLISIIFYMFVVFGVMMDDGCSRRQTCENASLLTAFHTRRFAFSRAFFPFCASLPSAVCEKRALPFFNESAALRE